MDKSQIRKWVIQRKSEMNEDEIERYSAQLAEAVFELDSFKKAECVFAYHSFNQEVRTFSIIERAIDLGKRVALPRITNGEMQFRYINSLKDSLVEGYKGISEPDDSFELADGKEREVWMLMPGLAFDAKGTRIGYGKGYYDRYLEHFPEVSFLKVALCYDFQVVSGIAAEAHDHRIDRLIAAPLLGTVL